MGATWTWVQPLGRAALLQRLADARDLEVSARERENLCSVALSDITRLSEALEDLVNDSYSFGKGVYRCRRCEEIKGERTRAHTACPVGRAEAVLVGKGD